MTKNDMASLPHNDGGAAKTRLDGESATGDVDALVEKLRDHRHITQGDGLLSLLETCAQAAEALTSLRTERDEARAVKSHYDRVTIPDLIETTQKNFAARRAAEARALKFRTRRDEEKRLGDTRWKFWKGCSDEFEARALKAEAENKALLDRCERLERGHD